MIQTKRKEKVNDNPQVNFNASREVAYWAKKFNITPYSFQQIFESHHQSISKTLAYCSGKM